MSKITYIGVDDKDLDLFESQYAVPEGMCYNSYLVEGEKIAVMDSVDKRKTNEWLDKLAAALNGRTPDYLVVQHMEPDHSGSVAAFLQKYPSATIVCSVQAQKFMLQFNDNLKAEIQIVKEGDTIDLGADTVLKFFTAPMVHWPEVIVTYLESEQTLFSADGFGKFGVYDADPDDWACEARRYYFNICGKYGNNVAALLKKAANLKISRISPLHGPVLEGEKLAEALRLYSIWSAYDVETPGGVLVAYASIHGNTAVAANKISEMLKAKGAAKVAVTDLSRDDMAEAIEDAFRMGALVLACATYDGGIFPPMHNFLHKLTIKGFQRRKVGLIENGTWAPQAAKVMRGMLEGLKDVEIVEPVVSLRSSMKEENVAQLEALADAIVSK
ncbi:MULTISPECIES: FprA family A-type flavoprotein [unclassified Bacteroides]|uniref:FprA family A-type flavoprotein n=1 Tax=unclassified Bacteroides TaxID=2646097 RepID=UPI0004E1A3E6|nr:MULTISPECIES: FprA family A-type flavoprotein [unclassified Bacteroides]